MIRSSILLTILAGLALLAVACSGSSGTQHETSNSQTSSAAGETPAPTIAPTAPAESTLEAASAPSSQETGAANNDSPTPTAAPTAVPATAAPAPTHTIAPTTVPKTILTQALESPGLMWCLADKVGMDVLIELDSRAATSA